MTPRFLVALVQVAAVLAATAAAATEQPTLPPVGRSLFDFLVSETRSDGTTAQVIPYPFEALKARIARQLEATGGTTAAPKAVLVPLGRSLQRMAAAPDFFKHPRAVMAVDQQPVEVEGHSGLLLADRLYLGFQEVGGVIEVISYNEAAGRFEFQQVEDYRPGGQPYVVYVERSVCLACHQNQAPIFATAEWDETNANPQIAAQLAAAGARTHGIPIEQGIDLPDAIDESTGRANRLAAFQAIWMEGCGARGEAAAVGCRADALLAVLQLRLSGGRAASAGRSRYRDRFAAGLVEVWPRLWPDGLAIPSPDVPNRRLVLRDGLTERQLVALVEPEGVLSAEAPRAPLDRWHLRSPDDPLLGSLVAGLGSFLAAPDMARLDRHLAGLTVPVSEVSLDCRLRRLPVAGQMELRLRCSGEPDGVSLTGYVRIEAGKVVGGVIREMALPGRDPLANLAIRTEGSRVAPDGGELRLALAERGQGLSARFSDGDRVGPLVLSLGAERARGRLAVQADFATITAAVARLAEDSRTGRSDALGDRPLRRARVMADLFERLGMVPLRWCCLGDAGLPPPVGP